jgi:hypothetical protein
LPQDVGLRCRAARIACICGADDVACKRNLFIDQRRCATTLLEHQVGIRDLNTNVERRAVGLRSQPIDVSESGRAAMSTYPRQRNLLLDPDAEVGPIQHERQMIE